MLFKDQMHREVLIKNFPPQKIISLVPSITELLVDLGLEEQLVAVTKFCIHPENIFRVKEKIGGTKNLNIEKIKQLQPDLIIGNKEENVKEQIEIISQHFPVWMSDVNSYEDAIQMIKSVGEITNTATQSNAIVQAIEHAFEKISSSHHLLKNKKVIYLIWYNPYMAVGKNTYIQNILTKLNINNAASFQDRYFEITVDKINSISPDYVLLSSEPFPFKEKHKVELQSKLHSSAKVILVDGEMFSWYGSRMKHLPDYLFALKES